MTRVDSDLKNEEVILTWRSCSLVIGAPCITRKKMSDKEDVEEEENKEEKYVQLEFEFDEDLVAPI